MCNALYPFSIVNALKKKKRWPFLSLVIVPMNNLHISGVEKGYNSGYLLCASYYTNCWVLC